MSGRLRSRRMSSNVAEITAVLLHTHFLYLLKKGVHFILKLTQQKFLVNPALTKLSKNHEIQCDTNLIDCKHLLHKYVAYCIFVVC